LARFLDATASLRCSISSGVDVRHQQRHLEGGVLQVVVVEPGQAKLCLRGVDPSHLSARWARLFMAIIKSLRDAPASSVRSDAISLGPGNFWIDR
jgi:hypothetical protein